MTEPIAIVVVPGRTLDPVELLAFREAGITPTTWDRIAAGVSLSKT